MPGESEGIVRLNQDENVMKRGVRKVVLIVGIPCVAITLLVFVVILFFHPPGPIPICGRLLDHTFQIALIKGLGRAEPGVDAYPNVQGSSRRSLELLEPYVGEPLATKYMYVPGLRETDPNDLILLYMKDRTRYRWEGDRTSIFRRPRWSISPPTFMPKEGRTGWEMNEWVDTSEFRKRLQKTLSFLKENKRPHWEAVVKEHTEFLNSIEN